MLSSLQKMFGPRALAALGFWTPWNAPRDPAAKTIALLPPADLSEAIEQLQEQAEAMREQQERYRAAFKLSPAALHTLDADMRISAVSRRWLELLGYEREQVIGRHINELLLADKAPETIQGFAEMLAAPGDAIEFERRLLRADGSMLDTTVSARLEIVDGRPARVHASLQDITSRKIAEAKLIETQNALAQARKMEAIGQLTGGVAHDFNNMLQAVDGYLSLMEKRFNLGAPLTEAQRATMMRQISNARHACAQAAQTAAQLLTVARRQQLDPRPFDPVKTVRSLDGLFRASAAASGNITIRWVVEEGVGNCHADPHQLKAAVINLVNNACDALAGKGGTITILFDTAWLPASSDPDCPAAGEYVRISVRDDGPGMSREVRDRAFEPFFTTKEFGKGTNGTGGTGLGLAQTYGFARQSGGTVILEAPLGLGCNVAILLPRLDDMPLPQQPPGTNEMPEGQGETVLIVEDEPFVREALSALLTDLGYKIIETQDADQALAALRTAADPASDLVIDAMLTDNAMPGSMLGMDLARLARQQWPDLPVMLITGRMDNPVAEVTAMGARFLAKPYQPAALARGLREMLAAMPAPPKASQAA